MMRVVQPEPLRALSFSRAMVGFSIPISDECISLVEKFGKEEDGSIESEVLKGVDVSLKHLTLGIL